MVKFLITRKISNNETNRKENMKEKKRSLRIKTSKLPGQPKFRDEATRKASEAESKRFEKLMSDFEYDDDEPSPNSRDIEKAESMPEWIGGGVFDPRWDDVYLDLDPEHPTPELQPTAEELAERRAIEQKAGQDACDLLNKFYRLGKYADSR
jgi:hypothetical protein